MSFARPIATLSSLTLLSATLCFAQAGSPATLAPQTTLPIAFTKTVSAKGAKSGDVVEAKTTQQVRLANGQEIARGARVLGHVVSAQPFVFNKTPYAKQSQAVLAIEFDTLVAREEKIPLHVYVRVIADYFATHDASEPQASDIDPDHSTTQVGGDIVTPSQKEIVSSDGDIVGYNKRGGNFAHLIANTGAGGARCDGTDTEQPVSIFSASACGAYGFVRMTLTSTGYGSRTPELSFSSDHRSPEIHSDSTALLEVVPDTNLASSTR